MAEIDVKIKVAGEQAKQALSQFTKSVKEADTVVGSLQGSVKGLGGTFSVFVGSLAADVTQKAFSSLVGGLTDFVKSSVVAASQIENLQARFQTLTGSLEDAARLTQEIQDIADNSPFDDLKVADAARELLLFGTNVSDVKEELQVLGDVSVASGVDLTQLTTIFSRIRDTGALASDTFKQLVKNGIPIGDELSKSLGISEQAVKKLAAEGKISADVFEDAFKRLNKEGSFAFQAIDKQGQTLDGRLKKLRDNFDNLKEDLGAKLSPTLKGITTAFASLIEKIRTSAEFDQFVKFLAKAIPEAIGFTFEAIGFLVDGFFFLRSSLNFVTASLAAVESGYLKFVLNITKYLQYLPGPFMLAAKAIQSQKDKIEDIIKAAEEQGTKAIEKNEEIAKTQQKLNELIQKAKNFTLTSIKEVQAAEEEAAAANDSRAEKKKQQNQFISETDQKLLDEKKKNIEETKILEEAYRMLTTEGDFLFQEQRLMQLGEYFTLEEQARLNAQLKAQEGTLAYETTISQIQKDAADRKIKLIAETAKKQADIDKKTKEDQVKLETATAQARGQVLQGFFNFAGAVAKDGSKAQFLIQKAAAISSIIVATQQAAAQALAVPPAPNLALAGLAKTAGALNLGAVLAQTIKGYEDGGVVGGNSFSGDKVMVRVNSGEMILNREQQSNLFKQVNSPSTSNQNITVHTNVVVDGETIARAVSKQVANGFALGEVQ